MKIIDITRTLQDAPLYPGTEPAEFTKLKAVENGDAYDLSAIKADVHTGTHADAFGHFLGAEGASIDKMPLELYCGKCRVVSTPTQGLVTLDDLRGKIAGAEKIVLHTGGGAYLCEEAAEYLVSCGVKTVVTDAVSVAPEDNESAVHLIFFNAGTAVIENAVLDGVEDGEYLLFAFPAKYGGCEAAPVSAVLITE